MLKCLLAVVACASLSTQEFLTFRAPVGLPGVTLVAGRYSFEVVHLDRGDVVRVRYQKTNRVTFEGITQRIERPKGMRRGDSVLLDHARPGEIARVIAWFPIDGAVGYRFMYDELTLR